MHEPHGGFGAVLMLAAGPGSKLRVGGVLDQDDVEAIGLVKFDFLGLTTLTILDWTLRYIRKLDPQSTLNLEELPLDDAATYALLARCQTTAVFQLESRGMKDLMRRLVPEKFDEIVALVALFRPGPLESGMVGPEARASRALSGTSEMRMETCWARPAMSGHQPS